MPSVRQAQVFTDNFDYLVRTMRRFGVVEVDVEDLAQDVFLVMCRRWSEYRPEVPIRSWLAGIAFNVARKHLARIWREMPDADIDAEDPQLPPDESLQARRARQLVLRALEAMRPRDRVILSLCEIDEVPVQEVAALLSIPRFTAYSRLRRARERFAEVVTELQRRTPARPALSPAALLAVERQPPPRSATSEERARRVMRAALSRGGGPVGRTFPRATSLAAGGLIALIAIAGYVVTARSRASTRLSSSRAASGFARDLAGVWRFDEGAGSAIARDDSGVGRDCQLRALDPRRAWVDGLRGSAVALDRGWIECPQPAVVATARTPMSVALWVKVAAFSSGFEALVTRQQGHGPEDYFFLGLLGSKLSVRSSLWAKNLVAPQPLALGRWVHVAFTHDGQGVTRLYQDGVQVNAGASSATAQATIDAPVCVGTSINGSGPNDRGQQFSGAVDELAVWDRALAPEEIAQLARPRSDRPSSGRASTWNP